DAAAGHVVEHDGQFARGFSAGPEVLVPAFLGRLVVVGHDLQLTASAHVIGNARQFDGFLGGVGAAAGHDRHPAGRLLDGVADDFAMLCHVDGGGLARGADHADAVRAFGNVPVDEFAQAAVVHAAVYVHGRDEGDDAAGEERAGSGHGNGGNRKKRIL